MPIAITSRRNSGLLLHFNCDLTVCVLIFRYVEGCLQSCDDADGCNPGSPPASSNVTLLTAMVVMPLLIVVGLVPRRWGVDV